MFHITRGIVTAAGNDTEALLYHGAVYSHGTLIVESLRPEGSWRFGGDAFSAEEPRKKLDQGIYIGRFFYHFGHFLVETLPSLYWATLHPDRKIIAHPWPGHLDWQITTVTYIAFCLEALGVDRRHIVLANEPLVVDDLLIAPQNQVIHGKIGKQATDIYARVAKHAQGFSSDHIVKRIYFSRRRFTGKSRLIVNEAGTEEVFRERGFAIVHPETLTFAEQVSIAAGANIIAGIDGSALHLCSFMRAGGKCIVVNSRGRTPAIETLNILAGVETDWIDGYCSIEMNDGKQTIIIDNAGLKEELKARTWL